jgi:hypothetical protein
MSIGLGSTDVFLVVDDQVAFFSLDCEIDHVRAKLISKRVPASFEHAWCFGSEHRIQSESALGPSGGSLAAKLH